MSRKHHSDVERRIGVLKWPSTRRPPQTSFRIRSNALGQRTLLRALGPVEEVKSLSRHAEDVRAGRCVTMARAQEREKRNLARGSRKRTMAPEQTGHRQRKTVGFEKPRSTRRSSTRLLRAIFLHQISIQTIVQPLSVSVQLMTM